MSDVPVKQRSAREQLAAGVTLPYFVDDLDGPVNYNLTLMVIPIDKLDDLVLYCRKHAAAVSPNPNDNRNGKLDYPATNRERVDVLRHICINRTDRNSCVLAGYSTSFDNLLYRISAKGIDVDSRQLELRRHVLTLIAEYYPSLGAECEYQWWLASSGLKTRKSQ